jgi:hypothetical protein
MELQKEREIENVNGEYEVGVTEIRQMGQLTCGSKNKHRGLKSDDWALERTCEEADPTICSQWSNNFCWNNKTRRTMSASSTWNSEV